MRRLRLAGFAVVLSTSLAGCNSGLAAIFGSENDDNASNAPSSVSARVDEVDGDGELDIAAGDFPFPIGCQTTTAWGIQ